MPQALATCDAVLSESCFHLPYQSQRLRLRTLLIELPIGSVEENWHADARIDVVDWLLKYSDHEPDWADAWLAVLSARPQTKVWTYDPEFRSIWRRPDGSAIPLALK